MMPQTAVVCAAHTDLGKHVVHNLLRSAHIAHVYGLSELDVRDSFSNLSAATRCKLTLLIHPLDYLERTIAGSIPRADLGFYCVCTPRHAVPSLGAYLYHKLNYDIPIRFLHEMASLNAHSVTLFSHPSAASNARSQFLRVKGQLMDAASDLQLQSFPNVPRVVFLLVPTLISHSKRPHFHHANDHAYNGVLPRPLSALDKIKQRAVIKHDPDTIRPLLAKDVAAAMVADALDSVITVERDDDPEQNAAAALRKKADLYVLLDPPRIIDLARTARALRRSYAYGATVRRMSSATPPISRNRFHLNSGGGDGPSSRRSNASRMTSNNDRNSTAGGGRGPFRRGSSGGRSSSYDENNTPPPSSSAASSHQHYQQQQQHYQKQQQQQQQQQQHYQHQHQQHHQHHQQQQQQRYAARRRKTTEYDRGNVYNNNNTSHRHQRQPLHSANLLGEQLTRPSRTHVRENVRLPDASGRISRSRSHYYPDSASLSRHGSPPHTRSFHHSRNDVDVEGGTESDYDENENENENASARRFDSSPVQQQRRWTGAANVNGSGNGRRPGILASLAGRVMGGRSRERERLARSSSQRISRSDSRGMWQYTAAI